MFAFHFVSILRQPLGPLQLWQWAGLVLAVLMGVLLGLLAARLLRTVALRLVRRTTSTLDDVVVSAIHAPLRMLCALLMSYALMTPLNLPADFRQGMATCVRAASIAAVCWSMIRALHAVALAVADGNSRETIDPIRLARARSLRTQVIVANRVVSVLIFVVGSALVALQFSAVRSIGMSLLASAGVAGVVLGFAAQKSLGTLLAGIQLSVSQPIRIGDAVVLEEEFGTIEDIGLTYVAVRLWDERRLIVPTPRFLELPFQNWSRATVGLVGSVMLKVDFALPVAALRSEFERLLAEEPLWDGRVQVVHVTDAGDRCMELRILVSARSPAALWDLRAAVREKLVTWLQTYEGGVHLPRARLLMSGAEDVEISPPQPSRLHA